VSNKLHSKKNKLYYYPDQSWTCVSCGRCCGIWDIPITLEEKLRIEKLAIPGFDFSKNSCFSSVKGHPALFLIKKNGGSCIFLDSDNYCVIHKYHGESVKALACRMYPYNISIWKDGAQSVSLRFDCTAVSENRGRPLQKQTHAINSLVRELSSIGSRKNSVVYRNDLLPELSALRIIAHAYKEILFSASAPFNVNIYFASCLLKFHENGDNRNDILNPVEFKSASLLYLKEQADLIQFTVESANRPDKLCMLKFNYLLTGYVRVDEQSRLKGFFRGRLGRARDILKFVLGKGDLHKFGDEYPDTSRIDMLAAVEHTIFHEETENIIKRYYATQLESLHFCGSHGLNFSFEEGMRHLFLVYPAIIALTALFASAEKRTNSNLKDVYSALRIIDHTFYHSPFFKLKHVKKIIYALSSEKKLPDMLNTFSVKIKSVSTL